MVNCIQCKSTFENVRSYINHIPSCQSGKRPVVSVIHLSKFARKRFIDSLQIHCYECGHLLPLIPSDDYLICAGCSTKHDLLLSRQLSKKNHYLPADKFSLFGGAL